MKRVVAVLMVVSLFGITVPAIAAEHGANLSQMDEQCAKECEMLLRNCALEVDSIQQRITRLNTLIKEKGANVSSRDRFVNLENKLKEANALLESLQHR